MTKKAKRNKSTKTVISQFPIYFTSNQKYSPLLSYVKLRVKESGLNCDADEKKLKFYTFKLENKKQETNFL